MIRFITLSLRNFLSYGNAVEIFNLESPGTTLVIGEDLDNTEAGVGGNGVGKTTMLNALSYVMYDKAVSDISKDNLVNNINKKNMEVIIIFEKDDIFYKIIRARKMKVGAAGNYVKIFKRKGDDNFEAADEETRDSISNTNSYIEKIMGIPYEIFTRVVVFSATNTPFLDLPVKSHYAANQTDIIEELFNLTTLSEKAIILKEQSKETVQHITDATSKISILERELIRHTDQITSAKLRVVSWENQNTINISSIEDKLERVEGIDFEQQRVFYNEIQTLNNTIQQSTNEQDTLDKEVKRLQKKIIKASDELVHLQDEKCPYCLQKYKGGQDKITECKSVIKENKKTITELDSTIIYITDSLLTSVNEKNIIEKQITVSNLEELLTIKNQASSLQDKISELKSAENPFVEPLEELQNIELESIDYEELNKLTKLVDHQKFLLKLLTKKDSFVRKILLNKNLPFLNGRLQYYLNELGLPHRVEFTHQLTARISQFGRELDFGNLSNGQRARVNIALSFAFRDILQNRHSPINICVLDEILDVGLDVVGIQHAARMLKRKARDENLSIYIISHRDEITSTFDRNLTIQMKKGFSSIKKD